MSTVRIFLDTANVDEIREAVETGIVDAIATNPNKFAQVGRKYEDVIKEIRTFFDGPVALEALSLKAADIYDEALRLSDLAENIVIKIPANKEGIKAISKLVPRGVLTNATLIFNPAQGLAAGLAGSPFISPFVGRGREVGTDGMTLFADIREMYDNFGIESVMIAGSIRTCYDAVEVIRAGADAIALTYPVFNQLMYHPQTELGIKSFLDDYSSID